MEQSVCSYFTEQETAKQSLEAITAKYVILEGKNIPEKQTSLVTWLLMKKVSVCSV